MRLEWLEDILAVIDTGSLSAAAERRFLTQPAFSRRIRVIEAWLGAELFDRERRPVVLKPGTAAHEDDIRRLVAELKELVYELQREGRETHNRLVVASQHAITATRAAGIVERLSQRLDSSVRLRSANRDECMALLLTKQADLVICYRSLPEEKADGDEFLELLALDRERLIPVIGTAALGTLDEAATRDELPVIAYPSDAFLGRVFNDELVFQLPRGLHVRRTVETALTIAAMELAGRGIGVAWLPENLVRDDIDSGRLSNLADRLPATELSVAACRLTGRHSRLEDIVWHEVLQADACTR